MEVASPTAGSVLVEVSQLQLLQVCHQVTVRTMSPHGESADSILAPVGPALAAACLPPKLACTSPRPGPEARSPLVPASPGLGEPNSPLQHLEPPGTRDSSGGLPTNLTSEVIPEEPSEERPALCSQVLGPRMGIVMAEGGAWGLNFSSRFAIAGGDQAHCARDLRGQKRL